MYAAIALLALLGLAVLGARTASSARARLLDGRDAMEQARTALLEGDPSLAADTFAEAGAAFGLASDLIDTPLLRVASWVPLLGRTPDAVTAMAEAGQSIARAGEEVSREVLGLPGGLAALAPTESGLDPRRFARLAPALHEAAELVREALPRIESISTSLVLGPVREAQREALAELRPLDRLLSAADDLFEELPGLLGESAARRYFVAAQNPAELRGTGGLIGAHSILTIRDGDFDFDTFLPIQDLPTFRPRQVQAPNEDYARNYNPFGGAGFWLNINMTPDFPSAAQAILTTYERATGETLDGVIAADPFALEALAAQTGPVEIPTLDVTLDQENLAAFVMNEAYRRFPDQGSRKIVLGNVAEQVFNRFMGGGGDPVSSMEALAEMAGEGHLKLYSADPEAQAALTRAGVTGSLEAEGDLLAVVQNNAGGNKLDFYLDRAVTHMVRLGPDGNAEAATRIHLENHAPDSGEPEYVIGPYEGISEAGENVSFVSVFCHRSCRLREAERDGEGLAVTAGEELGHRFFRDYLQIPSGGSADLTFHLAVEDAWTGGRNEGRYSLTILNQPSYRPSRLRVEVEAPEGMLAVSASEGARIEGSRVIWEGTPEARITLEIEFRRPISTGLARYLVPLLERPVVRL